MKCPPCAAAPGLTTAEAARRLQQYGPNEAVLGLVVLYLLALDFLKVWIVRAFQV